jgi:hypothetical protein
MADVPLADDENQADVDKHPLSSIQLPSAMTKWLTSLMLILTLGAGVLAGMPLHADEQGCTMAGMSGDMDCCKKARGPGDAHEVTTARLCCAVNCPQSGTTAPAGIQIPRNSTLLAVAIHPALVQPPMSVPPPGLRQTWAHSPPQNSNPAYIRHLALLI